ncbi:hypothetical protein KP004_00945 [Geomonas oryzisoli]|uniref:Glycosyl hydrolase family 13 catalytic domain-containing protein n=1 Tax=Geomonas oryzisoli TaxID=2847992 RepID=A0ABX8JAP8_9BACT|nr:alpha-amylase family glycosyl hydrolase [Geomonas oryzisoli]QWV93792.1 hypothetical protein KP004_00945 [Geomonas oryzisoli]
MAYSPWIGNFKVNGRWGNYGTVKLLLDETMSGTAPGRLQVSVEIAAQGSQPEEFEVELFSNLNRRDFVRTHEPLADSGGPTSYWMPYRMSFQGRSFDNLVFTLELPVQKCGAYRITARYRSAGSDTWWWHNDFSPWPGQPSQRDCAVVVSPGKAAQARLYEANALTVEALAGGSYENRSTLDDFLSTHDFDGFNPFQLTYINKELGFNTLWLMPVFPNTQWRWDRQKWDWATNDSPGSPYSSRDYWSINRWLADNAAPARALELFQTLFREAKDDDLDVFIDLAFNHAGRDVIYGAGAVDLGFCSMQEQEEWVRQHRPSWCTRGTAFVDGHSVPYYREAAHSDFECAVWAPADRLNEHIWDDANVDWFFGDYSALGPKPGRGTDYWGNPVTHWDPKGNAEDERDILYSDLASDSETERLWQYFGYILPYWIEKSGGKLAGIRADFAQGLPNQLWEYIVNRTRKARWDFIFLAEVLDPDVIQYRLNRVFDVLTTKDHHLYRMNAVRMTDLFHSLEAESTLFGGEALVMHNGTSHDEMGNDNKWAMMARYAVTASIYGCPMIFMGQPLGLADKLPFRDSWANMYKAWTDDIPEREAVGRMYLKINQAREATPELREPNRYFLCLVEGGFHEEIYSVARWRGEDGERDAVTLVFVNLDTSHGNAGTFRLPGAIRLSGEYQARNLVADDPNRTLWPAARNAQDIYDNGIYVVFTLPNEVQYLKLVRV